MTDDNQLHHKAAIVLNLKEYADMLEVQRKNLAAQVYTTKKKLLEVEAQITDLTSDPEVLATVDALKAWQ